MFKRVCRVLMSALFGVFKSNLKLQLNFHQNLYQTTLLRCAVGLGLFPFKLEPLHRTLNRRTAGTRSSADELVRFDQTPSVQLKLLFVKPLSGS